MKNITEQYLDYLQEIIPISVMVGMGAAGLVMNAFQLYKQHLTKAARMCEELGPQEKNVCMLNWKVLGKKKQIAKLKDSLLQCKKTKKPEECRKKMMAKIEQETKKGQFFESRLKYLKKQKLYN